MEIPSGGADRALGGESGIRIEPGPFALARLSIGHATFAEAHTGATVLLFGERARGAVDVRGGAPGTRESEALEPGSLVPHIHGLVLSGGSAFGLDVAGGVVRFLEERGVGFVMPEAVVPIVPAAVIYDLRLGGGRRRPDAASGYAAAAAARDPRESPEGNVGAGTGATVGKALGAGALMKGGLGLASARAAGRYTVGAIAVVNAFGDVVDPATGRIVAGCRVEGLAALTGTGTGTGTETARFPRGGFANTTRLLSEHAVPRLRAPSALPAPQPGASTTLVAIVTDAPLGKLALKRVAKMAHDGLGRAIRPVHTPYDGDVIYAVSLAQDEDPEDDALAVGAVAAEVAAAAIVRAVLLARSVPGAPAASERRAA